MAEDNSKLIQEISESIKQETQKKQEQLSKIQYVDFDDIELENTSVD